MKKLFTILAAVLITAGVFAQSPEKMSYQAVIRNSSDQLVTDQAIGMQISILHGTADGSPVYVETQTPTTNANGLVSIEIGAGTVVSGDFSSIDWTNGPYFIKTETDPAGGTSYTITGTSQLLSVPYALHAKTAETASESDPLFTSWDKTTGIYITESQISDLGNYIETETDPLFAAWDKSTGITITESQISDLNHFQTSDETDPVFMAWDKDYSDLTGTPTTIAGYGITDAFDGHYGSLTGTPANLSDFTNDVGYLTDYTVTETDVTAHQAALTVTESQISDLGTYIETETDPVFAAWDKSTGITITESQVTDLRSYLTAETDPAVTANFDFTDAANGDLLQFNGTKWVKVTPDYISDYTVTESDVTAHQTALSVTESQISDLGSYIETETDPTVTKYSVGDFAQGGIVFWVDETGQHGLVCAKEDQNGGSPVRWYAGTYGNTQAKGDGPYAGEANTSIIIAAQVAIGDDGDTYAARICNELQVTESGKTYGDWYLPSKEELNLMYQNKATIDATAGANGGSGFVSAGYWSSTENNNSSAWAKYFGGMGGTSAYDKLVTPLVRAVRAF